MEAPSASNSGTGYRRNKSPIRHRGGLLGLEKVRRLADARGYRARPSRQGDAPAPIDQLLVRELRRQDDTEQRDDAGGGPLPAGAEALALAAVLDQKGNSAAELRKPLQQPRGGDDDRR